MKHIRFFLISLLAFGAAFFISACDPKNNPPPTPAQVLATVCPLAPAALSAVSAGLPEDRAEDLKTAGNIIAAVCAGPAPDAYTLQAAHDTGGSALQRVLAASNLDPGKKAEISISLSLVHVAVGQMLAARSAPQTATAASVAK